MEPKVTSAISNKYPGTCRVCGTQVAKFTGICEKIDGAWRVRCLEACQPNPVAVAKAQEPKPKAVVGDLTGILALFAKAKTHLKFPAIVLSVGTEQIRINVAGPKAKVPGSLTIVTADKNGEGERDWLGRVNLDGTFQPSRAANALEPKLTEKLKAFSADPAKVAGEDGRLHGRCCFCRLPLSDERSTAVGYGKICADHFGGLPWGSKPVQFGAAVLPLLAKAENIKAEMQAMEAEGDLLQTIRDEAAKHETRAAMEGVR